MGKDENKDLITFDFIQYPFNAGRKIFRPVVNLLVENGDIKQSFYCLIDSGADESTSFVEIGEALGINFKDSIKSYVTGLDGEDTLVYHYPVFVEINGIRIPINILWQDRKLDPAKDIQFIIGRLVFFDKFDITFSQSRNKIYLKPVK